MFTANDIRRLIAERPGVSLRDLALHFKVTPPLMEMMLEKLETKGDVERVAPVSCCGGECGCSGEHKGYKLTLKAIEALRALDK